MRKLLTRLLAFMLLGLMLVPVAVQAQANDALTVVKGFVESYNRGDVAQTLSYFADDAVVKFVPAPPTGGSFSGKEQLRAFTQNSASNHSNQQPVGPLQVSGDKVTGIMRSTSDTLKRGGLDFLDSNFEAVVTNGKIASINISATPESLAKLSRPGGSGQGGAPAGAPATGAGGSTSNTDSSILAWLVGLALCGSLVAFIGLRLVRRKS